MHFDNTYYEDEVREGFYIPGMIKRSFAMQLEVLDKVRAICEKHEIKWYADCGTLIGAARHRGFIPWDDDLDICMLQDDYLHFLKVVEAELPSGYELLNLATKEDYSNFLTRIVNTNVINTTPDFLRENHGFPYTAGIDIFPLNFLYADEEQEEERRRRALELWEMLEKVADNTIKEPEDKLRARVKELSGYEIDSQISLYNGINRALDKVFFECDGKKSKKVALMPFYIKSSGNMFDIADYENIVSLPFEAGEINAPGPYEKVLKIKYGNWERVYQNGGIHDYPFYKEQERILKENSNGKLYYRYEFDENDLSLADRKAHEENYDTVIKTLSILPRFHELLVKASKGQDINSASVIVTKCQEQAISVGESLEQSLGLGTEEVGCLENYCEKLYLAYERLEAGEAIDNTDELDRIIADALDKYERRLAARKQIIFIVSKAEQFEHVRDYYNTLKADENCDVYVMPVPYIARGCDGSMGDQLIPKLDADGLDVLNYREFDFEHRFPDEIIILDGFDEYNLAGTVHPFFYALNLKKYTKRLVYIPCFEVDRISEGCEKARANVAWYAIIPAIAHADEIMLGDEWERAIYSETLVKQLGQESSKPLIAKLKVCRKAELLVKETVKPSKKTMLFYLSSSNVFENPERLLQKLGRVIDTFRANHDKLGIIWLIEKSFCEKLRGVAPELVEDFNRLREDFVTIEGFSYREDDGEYEFLAGCNGFYGSPGYVMNRCVRLGMPVMTMNMAI